MKNLTVVIWMVTYNQENFIEKAIESVMMQKTNFHFKLIIGEDFSKDNTRNICKKIQKKYHDKIELILHEKNVGPTENAMSVYKKCGQSNAKYMALLEGDDYWTDSLKLQKQVDFMEANPDYSICFHRVKMLGNNKLQLDTTIEKRYDSIEKLPARVGDLLKQGNFIHTASILFRNQLPEFPMEFRYSTVGDYFLFIMLSQSGNIKRLDDFMAVYRRNVGIYSSLSASEMNKKIAIYNSCILSYLTNSELKEILLKKQISIINSMCNEQVKDVFTIKKLSNRLSLRGLVKILLFKIKRKILK